MRQLMLPGPMWCLEIGRIILPKMLLRIRFLSREIILGPNGRSKEGVFWSPVNDKTAAIELAPFASKRQEMQTSKPMSSARRVWIAIFSKCKKRQKKERYLSARILFEKERRKINFVKRNPKIEKREEKR